LGGQGTLLFDEVVVTNASFIGDGVFVFGNEYSCDVSFIKSNFSSLSGEEINGTICRFVGVGYVVLISECVVGPSITADNGGAFYLGGCYCRIISSNFSECSAGNEGKGGATYFGSGSTFEIVDCNFSICSAKYGGAIYSESEEPSGRILDEVIFSGNTVTAGGNGNDIADNSTVGIYLYSSLTVTNCVSTSVSSSSYSNFYLLQGSGIFDCLLSSTGCSYEVCHVDEAGFDSFVCGLESTPCQSLTQALQNLNLSVVEEAEVDVASGVYPSTYFTVSSVTLIVSAVSETRPVLSLVTPTAGLFCILRRFMILLFSFDLLRCIISGDGEY
jgi:hypothetical protein